MQRKGAGLHRNKRSQAAQMAELTKRLTFMAAYLLTDLVYVLLSKSYYEDTVIAIQGKGLPAGRTPDALVAYALLAVGWFFVAAPSAKLWLEKGYRPAAAGAIAGLFYGLVLYGVYNFTLRAEFEAYGAGIALRDTCWGTVSAATFVALYAHSAYSGADHAGPACLLE